MPRSTNPHTQTTAAGTTREPRPRPKPLILVAQSQRDDLMLAVPTAEVRVEPSLARAVQFCIDGKAGSLWVDLHRFGPEALTALTQLRLLRPELEIVLVQRTADPLGVEETLLADLPQVWLSIPEVPGTKLRMAPIPVELTRSE